MESIIVFSCFWGDFPLLRSVLTSQSDNRSHDSKKILLADRIIQLKPPFLYYPMKSRRLPTALKFQKDENNWMVSPCRTFVVAKRIWRKNLRWARHWKLANLITYRRHLDIHFLLEKNKTWIAFLNLQKTIHVSETKRSWNDVSFTPPPPPLLPKKLHKMQKLKSGQYYKGKAFSRKWNDFQFEPCHNIIILLI